MDEDYGELSGFVALEPAAQRGGGGAGQPGLLSTSRGSSSSSRGLPQKGLHSGAGLGVDEMDSGLSRGALGLSAAGGSAQRGGLLVCGDPRASRRTGQWVEEHASASPGVEEPPAVLEDGYGYGYGLRGQRPRSSGEQSAAEGASLDGVRVRATRRDTSSGASGEASGRDSGTLGTPTKVGEERSIGLEDGLGV